VNESNGSKDGAAGDRAVLAGVRVADFSHALAGPLCTMILADLGAAVVKIERPGGDQVRGWGPPFHNGDAAYYYAANRSKRSVVLDLKDPEDRALACALVDDADVVVENSRPGVMARLGFGYDSLRNQRPDLIYCSITAFGPSGPPELAGYDLILQAVSGIMSVTGAPEGEPMKVGIPIVDQVAGLYATIGVLAALGERARSGRGQLVDVSLLGSALAALANRASGHLLTGTAQLRMGNAHPNVAPYELFQARDRTFVLAAANEHLWQRACLTLGRDELVGDPRYATNSLRVANRVELKAEIERTTRTRSAGEWVDRLTAAAVPAALVNDLGDAFRFAEELGLSLIEFAEAADGSSVPLVRSPIGLSRSRTPAATAPPRLDEHGAEIRHEVSIAAPTRS
jgi:crotonobetainyl-CoA:carnitine CoA-transferase CaiB-like acyl-CoA transferase